MKEDSFNCFFFLLTHATDLIYTTRKKNRIGSPCSVTLPVQKPKTFSHHCLHKSTFKHRPFNARSTNYRSWKLFCMVGQSGTNIMLVRSTHSAWGRRTPRTWGQPSSTCTVAPASLDWTCSSESRCPSALGFPSWSILVERVGLQGESQRT